MKKSFILLLTFCATALIYVSCSSDKNEIVTQTDTSSVRASMLIDAINEMDLKTGLKLASDNSTSKPTQVAPDTCPLIALEKTTAENYPRIFTVDYGTGCTVDKITKKGKLKITLTGPITAAGSKMTIERIDYAVNQFKLEGTIEYTNSTTEQTVPKWTRKVSNGKITTSDGRIFLNEGTYTTRQTAGVATPTLDDNVYEITNGTHTVISDKGTTLTLTILQTLIKKYSCEFISKGKLEIQGGFLNGVIDYGNNDCDNAYTYTQENGSTYNLTM
ncbi:hypothetical protein [Flavobacterium poyangense]|uniref:hypothetical protein n=1 Tax=Flavobacterium poyangense TaxID=2204302 RepID=UPI00141DDD5B|nr:hypothetical protein [Flavobacterium sp. JXAS1]